MKKMKDRQVSFSTLASFLQIFPVLSERSRDGSVSGGGEGRLEAVPPAPEGGAQDLGEAEEAEGKPVKGESRRLPRPSSAKGAAERRIAGKPIDLLLKLITVLKLNMLIIKD